MFADYISLIDVFSDVFRRGYSQLVSYHRERRHKIIINLGVPHLDNISDKKNDGL